MVQQRTDPDQNYEYMIPDVEKEGNTVGVSASKAGGDQSRYQAISKNQQVVALPKALVQQTSPSAAP